MKRALFLAGVLAVLGCEAQPMTLVNANLAVDNTGWSEETFSFAGDTEVSFQMKVIQGNMVDVRVCPEGDPATYKTALSGDKLRERSATVVLAKGGYVVKVRESTPKKEGGAVERATVSLIIKGKPSWGMRK